MKYQKTLLMLFLCFYLGLFSATSSSKTILTQIVEHDGERYLLGLLKLALSYSDSTHYQFAQKEERISQGRVIEEVKNGTVDVVWLGTDASLEEEMRPIRIPLLKGLLGHRIFIIRDGDQAKFSRVKTLDDLKQIKLGQGLTWADTKILEAAGLNVVKTMKYVNLFHMLEGGRFDAFPRGVHEPWGEVTSRRELNLTVEKELMLVYRYAQFFFVQKDNVQLANDIESGLLRAVEDGNFDKYFFSSPTISSTLEQAKMKNRRVFYIDNPALTQESRAIPDKFWLDISEL